MSTKFLIIVIVCIVLFFAYRFVNYHSEMTQVMSIDGNIYYVRNTKDKQISADTLAEIKKRLKTLVAHMIEKYPNDENVNLLRTRFRNSTEFSEGILDKAYTTYTLNKGDGIVFCLTTRDSEERIYDINTLMFVAIHELAHVGSFSINHTSEFKKVFKLLLKESIETHLYFYENYSISPKEYCGINITTSPV